MMTGHNEDDSREWEEAQARIVERMTADLVQGRVRKPARPYRGRRWGPKPGAGECVSPWWFVAYWIVTLVALVALLFTYDDPDPEDCRIARALEDPELVERSCP